MLFSVLIPLYNSEEYIAECLYSVLAQGFDDYEIVVVDDGSTDNSGAIADQYQKEYPQIRVIHKENEGVLLTRRRLLKEAKGDYILWVDSDDAVKQNWMSDLSREIQKNQPEMIIYDYEDYDDPPKVIHSLFVLDGSVIERKAIHDVLLKLILGRDLNELWSKCIKRELFDIEADYSEYKHIKEGDDLFCLLPVFDLTNRIVFLDRPYYRYRVIPSSITHASTYRRYYSMRTIFERIDHYIKKWGFYEQEICQVKDRFATSIVDCAVACANSPEIDYKSFESFVNDINADENNHPIYSDSSRHLSSRNYQRFYEVLIEQDYKKLYKRILNTTKLSRLKSKLFRR
jgi:glycosyltransferase involved in cell wall biosynthesis